MTSFNCHLNRYLRYVISLGAPKPAHLLSAIYAYNVIVSVDFSLVLTYSFHFAIICEVISIFNVSFVCAFIFGFYFLCFTPMMSSGHHQAGKAVNFLVVWNMIWFPRVSQPSKPELAKWRLTSEVLQLLAIKWVTRQTLPSMTTDEGFDVSWHDIIMTLFKFSRRRCLNWITCSGKPLLLVNFPRLLSLSGKSRTFRVHTANQWSSALKTFEWRNTMGIWSHANASHRMFSGFNRMKKNFMSSFKKPTMFCLRDEVIS